MQSLLKPFLQPLSKPPLKSPLCIENGQQARARALGPGGRGGGRRGALLATGLELDMPWGPPHPITRMSTHLAHRFHPLRACAWQTGGRCVLVRLSTSPWVALVTMGSQYTGAYRTRLATFGCAKPRRRRPCRPRRRGRGTLGLPPQGVEKQGYPPGLLVEDGPREPSAPLPGVIRTCHT